MRFSIKYGSVSFIWIEKKTYVNIYVYIKEENIQLISYKIIDILFVCWKEFLLTKIVNPVLLRSNPYWQCV